MSGAKKARGVPTAVLIGALLVPATAIAAVAIVGATTRAPSAQAASDDVGSTTTSEAVPSSNLDDDSIAEACTDGAEKLLEKEAHGDLSELETAALDALRGVCDEAGMAIAGPPAADPIIQTVFANSQNSGDDDSFDDDADDEYEHEEEDEYEHHEDEDHEDDHSDDGHEHETDD